MAKRPRADRRVVALTSDWHCGLRIGLLMPDTLLVDEHGATYAPNLTDTQRYLHGLYQEHYTQVKDFADGDPLILLMAGDATHGIKHTAGLWSERIADHVIAAAHALAPWYGFKNLQTVRIMQGTPAHTCDSTEWLLAREMAQRFPKVDTRSTYHSRLIVGQEVLDVAHHGPGGGIRQWTGGNEARHYLKSLVLQDLVNGLQPARLVLRAHVHRWIEEPVSLETGDETLRSVLHVTPGYSGANPHARQAVRSPVTQTHGMVAFEIVDGRYRSTLALKRQLDLRVTEVL
jgi:hypothetical protein